MGKIFMDEKTKIPLAWMFALFSVAASAVLVTVGVVFWLARVDANATTALTQSSEAAAKIDIERERTIVLSNELSQMRGILIQIRDRLPTR